MKIVIAGGDSKAEYIIKSFKDKKNELVVINPSFHVAERLKKACFVKVYHGEPWSRITLQQADAFDADVFISLCERDTDNYATCLMAKRMFNAKKTICVVDNPANVDIFKKLGLDAVISSTYLLSQSIMSESSVESLTKTGNSSLALRASVAGEGVDEPADCCLLGEPTAETKVALVNLKKILEEDKKDE